MNCRNNYDHRHTTSLSMRAVEHLLGVNYAVLLAGVLTYRRAIRATSIGVRALVVRGEEVLLVRHRGGVLPWGLPGGALGGDETLVEAAQREVREEAGCAVRVECLHGVFHSSYQGYKNCIVLFVCSPLSELRPPTFDIEIAEARYVPLRAPGGGVDIGTRARIAEYLSGEPAPLDQGWGPPH